MTTRWTSGLIALALLGGALACAPPRGAGRGAAPQASALRVGVAPDAPPIAFRQGDRLVGLEIDLANELAATLGRPLRLVEVSWGQLVSSLLDNRIDVIMSGLTVTTPRQARVAFAAPYLQSGMTALMRRREATRYGTASKVLGTSNAVGVKQGTTGEKFVREHMPSAVVSLYPTSQSAVTELLQNRIDLFIGDLPQILWFVAANEAELTALRPKLTEDSLAWAFRPDDDVLRASADEALAHWKSDGTLSTILRRWLRNWPQPL